MELGKKHLEVIDKIYEHIGNSELTFGSILKLEDEHDGNFKLVKFLRELSVGDKLKEIEVIMDGRIIPYTTGIELGDGERIYGKEIYLGDFLEWYYNIQHAFTVESVEIEIISIWGNKALPIHEQNIDCCIKMLKLIERSIK